MKLSLLPAAVLLFAFYVAGALDGFAQGSLTPPGPPGPTMKTLDQVRPGTPIDPSRADFATPYIISQSGNYYLTGNIAVAAGDAIYISASGVTLDLNGFTISSSEAAHTGNGITLQGNPSDITIRNGNIRGNLTGGGGFFYAILDASFSSSAVRVTEINISNCYAIGIFLSIAKTIVESCNVESVSSNAIYAGLVLHCRVNNCGQGIQGSNVSDCYANTSNNAIVADVVSNCEAISGGTGVTALRVSHCYVSAATNALYIVPGFGSVDSCTAGGKIQTGDNVSISNCISRGISTGKVCNVSNCVVQGSVGVGISVDVGSSVTGCTVSGSSTDGVVGTSNCYLARNLSNSNGGAGIRTTSTGGCIEGNTAVSNSVGIQADAASNIIIGNRTHANTTFNYSVVANNRLGSIVSAPANAPINGNGPGLGTGASDPFSNLVY